VDFYFYLFFINIYLPSGGCSLKTQSVTSQDAFFLIYLPTDPFLCGCYCKPKYF